MSRHADAPLVSRLLLMNQLICPLCQQPLRCNSQGLDCINRHQFDRAKEGYFNLLPVQYKHSREPGDAKAQLQARRTFLQAGFFAPLLAALQKLLPETAASLLDIGCGEGYFTGAFAQTLGPSAIIYGIDIAKEAIRLAAKYHTGCYVVASSYVLPIADASMDLVTRIYAPSKDEELQRVLAPGGKVIIVTPGQQHLMGLRQGIYQTLRPHPEPQAPQGFIELHRVCVKFALTIPAGEMTEALLLMTPFAWRLSAKQKTALVATGLDDQADFNIAVYGRS